MINNIGKETRTRRSLIETVGEKQRDRKRKDEKEM